MVSSHAMAERDGQGWRKLEASVEFCEAIDRVAGHALPVDIGSIFSKPYLACWSAHKNASIAPPEQSRMWFLVANHIEEVRQSVSAMHYHLENVSRIEGQIDLIIQKYQRRTPMARDGGNWNVNVTNRLTFEYHAFTFVSVRCLTYLSFCVGRILKKTCPNLRSLKNALVGKSDSGHHGTKEVLRVLCSHQSSLSGMFSEKKRRSVRDWIAHEAFLPAGSLKVSGGQAKLAGVLEASAKGMDPDAQDNYRLSDVMRSQFEQVETFVREIMVELEKHFLPRSS